MASRIVVGKVPAALQEKSYAGSFDCVRLASHFAQDDKSRKILGATCRRMCWFILPAGGGVDRCRRFQEEKEGRMDRRRLVYVSGVVILGSVMGLAAARNWQNGTLTGTEQEKLKEGSTKTSSTEGTAKDKVK